MGYWDWIVCCSYQWITSAAVDFRLSHWTTSPRVIIGYVLAHFSPRTAGVFQYTLVPNVVTVINVYPWLCVISWWLAWFQFTRLYQSQSQQKFTRGDWTAELGKYGSSDVPHEGHTVDRRTHLFFLLIFNRHNQKYANERVTSTEAI